MKYFTILLTLLFLTSCNEKAVSDQQAKNQNEQTETVQENEDDHEHHHEPPNGGILTEVGDHAASLEWLIEDGQLKIYIFDGCAEKPIRLAQEEIKVSIKETQEKQLTLTPVTNKLTGEKPGDANTFAADAPNVSTEKISAISVHSVTIQGIDYKNVNLKVE